MAENDTCPLCGRPLGSKSEKHHLIPRSKGGREMVALHPICHRKIHATINETMLARQFNTISALKKHPDIAKFIKWVARKSPDFYKRTERTK